MMNNSRWLILSNRIIQVDKITDIQHREGEIFGHFFVVTTIAINALNEHCVKEIRICSIARPDDYKAVKYFFENPPQSRPEYSAGIGAR